MDERLMPLCTFRCVQANCGEQVTSRLTDFHRHAGRPDVVSPHPQHHKKPMGIIQLAYTEAGK